MGRRHGYAACIRADALDYESDEPGLYAEMQALASELDDASLALDPACAVACAWLLDEPGSALVDTEQPTEALRLSIRHIRSGFSAGGDDRDR